MLAWLRDQWAEFGRSYVLEEALLKTTPKALIGPFLVGVLFTLGPAYIEPVASLVKFRLPWVATATALCAVALSFGFNLLRGKPPWGPVFVLLDTAFYIAALALATALTAPPASHAYAGILGIMLASSQARDYSLTLPFALSVCVPAIGIVLFLDRGAVDIIIVVFSCALALWLSHQTKLQRALRAQNAGLRVALLTNDRVTNESMDIALSHTLVGIGQFLHEMRNIQMMIHTNLRFLSDRQLPEEEFREVLEETLKGQQQIQELIERTVSELRAKGRSRVEPFDLSDVLQGGFATAARQARCEVKLPVRAFFVLADPSQLRDVLDNLVANAAQAGAKNVKLSCAIDASNESTTVEVVDDGPGIHPAVLNSLFQPFATFGKRGGTGLGLYLARRRVELMGGSLQGGNRPEGGARFVMQIPGTIQPPAADKELYPAHADS